MRASLLVLLSACAPDGPVSAALTAAPDALPPGAASPLAPAAGGAWAAQVQARIADATYGFGHRDGTWWAGVPTLDLHGRFEDGRAFVRTGEDSVAVEVVAWGRGDALVSVEATPWAAGACTERVDPAGKCIRRLELDAGGLVGWWRAGPDGLEQGFDVTPPPGEAPLRVVVAIDAPASLDGDALRVTTGGANFTVTAPVAWDDAGRDLPARFVLVDGGVAVDVDDTGATGLVHIDPTWSPDATDLDHEAGTRELGEVIASPCDVNGDAYADLISSAPTGRATGEAYVWLGGPAGIPEDADVTLIGTSEDGRFGAAIDCAGDTNGDGYDDIIVGAYAAGTGGEAYLFLGGAAGPDTTVDRDWSSSVERHALGHGVAGLGDTDGDGYDDVAIGAYSQDLGEVKIYTGGPDGPSATATQALYGSSSTSDTIGYSLAGVGDVNGDGHPDLLVHDHQYYFQLYLGSSGGITSTVAQEFNVHTTVAKAGDVNGDGFADVLFGNVYREQVYVYTGGAAGLTLATTLTSPTFEDEFGVHIGGGGDLNSDGYDDIVIGTSEGTAHVYHGSSAGIPAVATTDLSEPVSFAYDDVTPAILGDVDGDGYDDLALGAWSAYGGLGGINVYAGGAGGADTTAATRIEGRQDPYFGQSIAGAGDTNGDGYDDVVVGAYHANNQGAAYVFCGSATGVSSTACVTLDGLATTSYFGYAVDGAGDVNADGFADVIVGASGTAPGYAYVFHGSAAGLSSTHATELGGGAGGDDFGFAVAGAGDTNGDGYDDVLVGDPDADGTRSACGEVKLYYGSAAGIPPAAGHTFSCDADNTNLGASVSRAGDVNGDGYDDIVLSDPAYSTGSLAYGRIYVHLGAAGGISSGVHFGLTGGGYNASFGHRVRDAGDVNADGYDDIVVTNNDHAFVYYGSAGGLGIGAVTEVVVGDTREGVEATGVGDVNADGYDDLAAGHEGGEAGELLVFFGTAAGIPTTPDATLPGTTLAPTGAAVDGAGDVDGDGYDDIVAGDSAADGAAGHVAVYTHARDVDGDGYGTAEDCDDADAAVHPGATEVCDPADVDEDCSGAADDADTGVSASGMITVYVDADRDGHGGADAATFCDLPSTGYAATSTDCDDTNADAYPGATEVCDAADVDEDCDGLADDADASLDLSTAFTWHADADADGYGSTTPTLACEAPAGFLAEGTDCDDADAAVNPAGTEVCDPADVDEDCDGASEDSDGSVDRDGFTTWYRDADGDGHGGAATVAACDAPDGYHVTATDCDDADPAVNPDADEVCDPLDVDEDCDGLADEADTLPGGLPTWYTDADGDGYGGPVAVATQCDGPAGASAASTDCDDADPARSPAAAEVPEDGIDQDCDGADTCYADADADGFRIDALVVTADADCDDAGEAPASTPDGDCDDDDDAFHPGAAETDCDDDADYNCDGSTGLDDADEDGAPACEECDDRDPDVRPGAEETCNGVDDDCDGAVDEDAATDARTWARDDDGDGYTDPASAVVACDAPADTFAPSPEPDCDDTDADVFPGATEVAADGVDQDCDGEDLAAHDTGDTGDTGDDDGCGCATGSPLGGWLVVAGLIGAARRRSPRAAR